MAFGGLVAGCGGANGGKGTTASAGTFIGRVAESNAYIALVSDGSAVGGYVCDGKKVSTWLGKVSLADSKAKLTTRQGTRLGDAALSGDRASGQVLIAGKRHPFSARLASGRAGLYRQAKGKTGKPGSVETGWIVLADGSLRGAENFMNPNNFVIRPAPSSPDGKPVTAAKIWTEREVYR